MINDVLAFFLPVFLGKRVGNQLHCHRPAYSMGQIYLKIESNLAQPYTAWCLNHFT